MESRYKMEKLTRKLSKRELQVTTMVGELKGMQDKVQAVEAEKQTLVEENDALAAKNKELSQKQSERSSEGNEELLHLRQEVKRLEDTNATLCKENLEVMTELDQLQARAGEDSFVLPNPAKLKSELMACTSAKGEPFQSTPSFKSPAPPEFDNTMSNSFSASFDAQIFQDDAEAKFTGDEASPAPRPTTALTPPTTTPTAASTTTRRKRTTLGNLSVNSPMPPKKMKKRDMPSAIKPCSTEAHTTTTTSTEGSETAGEDQKPNECQTQ